MRIMLAALAAVMSLSLMTPAEASKPLEHIKRDDNLIRVTNSESGSFYYQTYATYWSARTGQKVKTLGSKYHLVNEDGAATLRVQNLPGKWFVKVTVVRGYGSSLLSVKTYRYLQK